MLSANTFLFLKASQVAEATFPLESAYGVTLSTALWLLVDRG